MVQSREERLRKKREAERRRYERLKSSADGTEYLKEKEKRQYALKKKKKIIVPITELSERAKRVKRKEWRLQKRDYRQRKNIRRQTLNDNTPPASEDENADDPADYVEKIHRAQRQREARLRKKKSRELKKKEQLIEKLNQKVEKYRKRYRREREKRKKLKNKTDEHPTPRTRVNILLNDETKKREVARKLLFAETITEQLDESYNELQTEEEKRKFKMTISGKHIVKNRLVSSFKRKMRINKKIVNESDKSTKRRCRKDRIYIREVKDLVKKFYLEDSSSRVMPGKKDCVTKGKKKMQKRYLNKSRKDLHSEFLRSHPEHKISYALFCKLKPFWVKRMDVSARDTCKCVHCANAELLAQSLHRYGILNSSKLGDIKKMFCCNSSNEECLFRKCKHCPPVKINNEVPSNLSQGKYYKWISVKEKFFDKKTKKERISKKVTKTVVVCTPEALVEEFEKAIVCYLGHQARIIHQYKAIKDLKKSLKPNEAVIQMDFSENYETKFSEEVQSFHFGGSRQQLSLHTVVVHVRDGDETKNINFCTLSNSLKHDVPAIWAHLAPVLKYIKNKYDINVLHFVSDGPSNQYRNKTMFYFLATQLQTMYPGLKSFSWNYLEAGHGKGAPDGIGGVSIRTADRVVAEGKDVSNLEQLMSVLEEQVKRIKYFAISESDIETMTKTINKEAVKPFKGTLRVHQVLNNEHTPQLLHLRNVSYFDSEEHLSIGVLDYTEKDSAGGNQCLPNTSQTERLRYEDVYSDNEEEMRGNEVDMNTSFSASDIKDETYVIVELHEESKNKAKHKQNVYRYVAVCQGEVDDDGEVDVKFLRIVNSKYQTKQLFRLDDKDYSFVQFEQIKCILKRPMFLFRGKRVYYRFTTELDIFEKP